MSQPTLDAGASLAEIASRYSRLEAVYALTRRIAAASDVDEVCRIAIEALVEAVPGRRCSILLFDREGIARFRGWHGLSEGYRKTVDGHCPWTPGQADARPIVLHDVHDDPELISFLPTFASEGIVSAAFIPLNGHAGVLGKFMVYGDRPGDPIGDELPLAENIADLVAIVVERLRSEAQLTREHALYADGPVVAVRWVPGGVSAIERISGNLKRQLGYDPEQLTSGALPFSDLVHPDDVDRIRAEIEHHKTTGAATYEQRYRLRAANGDWRQIYDRTTVVRDEHGRILCYDGYLLDVTDPWRLEEQLTQARKMESIGRLAGGVAHDFNNLLTVILGAAEHASEQAPPASELAHSIDSIAQAAARAATLTTQLLAFARKQVVEPRTIEINEVFHETAHLLRRVIGEQIRLEVHASPEPAHVRIDPGQLQQVLVNLALNARDAMPTGGTLTLCVDCSQHGGPPAPLGFLDVCVTDTGVGMSPETQEHLFEPFFTTKDVGKGTGLGLATCYGIVTQSGGSIEVTSALGNGSTFRIRLPAGQAADLAHEPPVTAPSTTPAPQGRTVLLAEDDPLVREFTTMALRRGGYQVLMAHDGAKALQLAKVHTGTIDLLLTDVVMPGLTGRDLALEIRRQRPGIAVLYATGYEPSSAIAPAEALPGSHMIQKPFTASELLQTVAEMCVRGSGVRGVNA
jgi:PAS domain S-box-containing protein